MRQSLGTAVAFGMVGVTVFGLIFTPIFYVLARKLSRTRKARDEAPPPEAHAAPAAPVGDA